MSWPDGGTTPFRGEKETNGRGLRVPCVMRWPGVIEPGTHRQRHLRARGLHPDLRRRNGEPDLVEKVKKGYTLGKNFKVHLDGYNLLPFSQGEKGVARATGFLYWSDDGDLLALRVGNWKVSFLEQNTKIPRLRWALGRVNSPNCEHLSCIIYASDPFERGPEPKLHRLVRASGLHDRAGTGVRCPLS